MQKTTTRLHLSVALSFVKEMCGMLYKQWGRGRGWVGSLAPTENQGRLSETNKTKAHN